MINQPGKGLVKTMAKGNRKPTLNTNKIIIDDYELKAKLIKIAETQAKSIKDVVNEMMALYEKGVK